MLNSTSASMVDAVNMVDSAAAGPYASANSVVYMAAEIVDVPPEYRMMVELS